MNGNDAMYDPLVKLLKDYYNPDQSSNCTYLVLITSLSSSNRDKSSKSPITCYRSGGPHLAPQCSRMNPICRYGKKVGNLAHVCRKRGRKQNKELANKKDDKNGKSDEDAKSKYLSESAPDKTESTLCSL